MIRALFGHDAAGAAWIGLADSLGDDECGITQEDGEIARPLSGQLQFIWRDQILARCADVHYEHFVSLDRV